MIDIVKLEFLRRNTKLSSIDKKKIAKLRALAVKRKKLMDKLERCDCEVDYSEANESEYNRRFYLWMCSLYRSWSKCNDGLDLVDFANMVIDQNLSKEMEKSI